MREERMTVQAADIEPGDVLVYTADRRLTVEEVEPKRVYVYIDATEWDGADPYAVKYALDDDVDIIRKVPTEMDVRRRETVDDMLARLRAMVDIADSTGAQFADQLTTDGVEYALRWGAGPAMEDAAAGRWASRLLDAIEGSDIDGIADTVDRAIADHRRSLAETHGRESAPMWRAVAHHEHRARARFVDILRWYHVNLTDPEGDR